MIVDIWLWFSVLIIAVLLIQFVLNQLLLPRLRPTVAPATLPSVSVLLPARNEALRIRSCLESLLKQNHSSLEIIVLDDESVDTTAEIAFALGFLTNPESKCRLIRGAPLPPGWTGKSWACHQLAEVARGDFLLFTDADTVHRPETVSSAVAAAQRAGCDLLTLWPFQPTVTFAENLGIHL